MRAIASAIAEIDRPGDQEILKGPDRSLRGSDLFRLSLAGRSFADQKVALCIADRFDLICAMIALDGWAAELLLLGPDLPVENVKKLMAQAGVEHIISDRPDIDEKEIWNPIEGGSDAGAINHGGRDTRWGLTTSGTTGLPKLIWHDRASLSRTIRKSARHEVARWGMLYDPSRFAGTQVMLQAVLGGDTLLVPESYMSETALIDWLVDERCTHLSATPSLWRRLMMAPSVKGLPLHQISLGGEIADDAILTALRSRFRDARITHIYASTETGVGFSVQDGRAGFPAMWLENKRNELEIAVRDGLMWLKLPGGMVPVAEHILRDEQGFICTRDAVERQGDRIVFLGREDASFNVGGVKIQGEAVEAVVHRHPAVAQCRITARPSPIMGNLLILTVAPHEGWADIGELRRMISQWCKVQLPRAAQPAKIHIVKEIPITAAGKMERVEQA